MRKPGPNILVMIADQQQGRTLDSSSGCHLPSLRKLLSEGASFSRTYTVNAICAPSRASLMTGLLPHNHGMVDNPHNVERFRSDFIETVDTLPARLRESGYSLGYFGKWHVERTGDLARYGFDRYVTEEHGLEFPRTLISSRLIEHPGYSDRVLYGVHKEDPAETEEHFYYTKATEFIQRAELENRSWCLFVSTNAPHDPYIAPRQYYELYDPAKLELPRSFGDEMEDKPGIYRRIRSVWKDLSVEDYQKATAAYFANCTLVDAEVGRLCRYLRELGTLDDTIVVFLSDHGDLMGSHGLLCKGIPAFDESYRIPFLVRWPNGGLAPGARDGYASIVDIAPTLLDLAGLQPLERTDGVSLAGALRHGGSSPRRSAYAEFYGQRYSCQQRIVWMSGLKYVFNGFDFDELYDHRSDPHEMRNLADDPGHASELEELSREMWRNAKESKDSCFLDCHYYMYRFAPVGPEQRAARSLYNRGAGIDE